MKFLSKGLDDMVFIVGLALVSVGASMIYRPAALIIPGVVLMYVGIRR